MIEMDREQGQSGANAILGVSIANAAATAAARGLEFMSTAELMAVPDVTVCQYR